MTVSLPLCLANETWHTVELNPKELYKPLTYQQRAADWERWWKEKGEQDSEEDSETV